MKASINNQFVANAIEHWKYIASVVREPQNEDEYTNLVNFLDKLLDIVGENESHELMGLIDIVSHLIEVHDEKYYPIPKASGIQVLKFLMEEHGLKQADIKEIGSQGVVSEILNGKRKLNITQIKKLAKRFHVSPETFID